MLLGNVAIVGRPNVGKSTLYNAITNAKVTSITSNFKGVTRDFLCSYVKQLSEGVEKEFFLFDTGGYETKEMYFQPFSKNLVWKQTQLAIAKADVVVLMFDATEGVHVYDKDLVQYLRKEKKKVIYVVNKIDGIEKEYLAWNFYKLGIKKIFPISSAHKRGLSPLKESICEALSAAYTNSAQYKKFDEKKCVKLSLIGRPNAGKSSILNRIIGEERSLVSDIAGTTRDSIDTYFKYDNNPYLLIDTAGIRRKTKINEFLEQESVFRSLQAINRSDVILYVIDAVEKLTDQDVRLINLALKRYKPVILIVNKWDLIKNKHNKSQEEYKSYLKTMILKDISYIPVHFISCLENKRVHNIMKLVQNIVEQNTKKAKTSVVNEVMTSLVSKHTPRVMRHLSKRTKFYYASQISTTPPTIIVKCNISDDIQESYKKYMQRVFKESLGFKDIPIRVIYKGKKSSEKIPLDD